MDYSYLEKHLGNLPIGHTVYTYRRCQSTMDLVHTLAWTHPPGTAVLAEVQTAGRGRHNRRWVDVAARSIAVSILLKDHLWNDSGSGVSLLSGLAVLEAAQVVEGRLVNLALEWPNDVVEDSPCHPPHKVAGVLVESKRDPFGSPYAVLGIGINVNHTAGQLPPTPGARVPATSLRLVAGRTIDRRQLIVALMQRLSVKLHLELAAGLGDRVWERKLRTLGRHIRAHGTLADEPQLEGVAEGTNSHGALLVRDNEGTLRTLHASEISLS